jgi:PleD family two-component response regulator
MSLKILVATESSEQILFLQDVLEEIQSGRHWRGWVDIQPLHALAIDFAVQVLTDEPVDAIVLDLALCGNRALDEFRRLHAAAPQTPVVLIAEPDDIDVAIRLMREGAQDFLLAHEVDAEPLARSLGNAIERHRLLAGASAARKEDSLTGLLNRTAFLALAERDRKLAEKFCCRWMVVIAEPRESLARALDAGDRQDLLVIETAEWLRRVAAPTDVVARVGDFRFALTLFDAASESLEAAWSRIHTAARENQIAIGASIFDFSHPAPLEILLEQAEMDLTPKAMAMRT